MRTIWKFPLSIVDEQDIVLPVDSHILCVQTQHEVPCIWVELDPAEPMRKLKHRITIEGTGHWVAEDAGSYVGTFQVRGGDLVFHVYDRVLGVLGDV